MNINYNLFSGGDCFEKKIAKKGNSVKLLVLFVFLSGIINSNAQQPLIDPNGAGGFKLGPTFADNGWTVANQGTGSTKWVVGTAVTANNVGTTQATTATGMLGTSYTVTLAAVNSNIVVGQAVSGPNIAANTYVSNISGTTLTLSQPTTNTVGISTAVTLSFTAISANITGNSAYVSTDNGLSNNYNWNAARRIYFYRDIALPSGETAYSLTFDVRSNGTAYADSWQVLVAPTSVTPVGSDSQIATNRPPVVPEGLTGALSLNYGAGVNYTQSVFASIPPSFAGQTVRLIFMWTNDSSGGASYPAAIDNIKLTSRAAGDIESFSSGIFSNPATWIGGQVPTAADIVLVKGGHSVNIDKKGLTVGGLVINGLVDYGFNSDEFIILQNFQISGSGSKFNNYFTTTGKSLKVGGNIDILEGGRFDSSVTSFTFGEGLLTLNGSALQTVTVDNQSFIGGTNLKTDSSNTAGVIGQLVFNNTYTASPNIIWDVNTATDTRIYRFLKLIGGRVDLVGTAKFIIGNYGTVSDGSGTSAGLYLSPGQGFLGGTLGRYFDTGASSPLFESGAEYASKPYPFISATGDNRSAFIVRPTVSGAAGGEVYVKYDDSNAINTVSIPDGAYTIDKQYNGHWTITKDATYTNTAPTDLAFFATGAYNALDGSSRISHSFSAASGAHVNGTNSPFAIRSGVLSSDLFNNAFYVGAATTSVQPTATKTSVASGDWGAAGTWNPNGVPACEDIVSIGSGNTVTVNADSVAGGINIASGGTLVNAAGILRIGNCGDGNNASFVNSGTHTISGGTLLVNGNVWHKTGSVLNQKGGTIIVDGNSGGAAGNSVGQGTSLFRIDNPSSINLADGNITIVDPLVNSVLTTSATTVTNFTAQTTGATGTFSYPSSGTATAPTSTIIVNAFNNAQIFSVGQVISGAGIPVGTTIATVTPPGGFGGDNVTLTLSAPITANIPSGTPLTFSTMSNGSSNVYLDYSNKIALGQIVTGNSIPANTTVTSISTGLTYMRVGLSNQVTGLSTSPITSPQTLTFSGASPNTVTLILNAENQDIKVGQGVGGPGIAPATTVSSITGTVLVLSTPTIAGITAPATVSFYAGNPTAFAFVYNSTKHSVAGMNHTLKFGNGASTDTGAVITNGFLVNTSIGGGVLSLGNLTVDAVNASRYFNSNNILNVQNKTIIESGSVFQKTKQANTSPVNYGASYFGGDIINNGTIITRASSQPFVLANYLNGAETATGIPQTISGSGTFRDDYDIASIGTGGAGSVGTLKINNTSAAGVTLSFPNFISENSFSMIAGILHTSDAYPLYIGSASGSNSTTDTASNFSNTCYVEGPVIRTFPAATSSGSISNGNIFPVGKSGTYLPISVAPTAAAGLVLKAEAFTSNSGKVSANISNLSTNRWKVEKISTTTLTDFKVRVGASDVTPNHIPVQASTDQGTYDNVLGTTAVFAAAGVNQFYPVNNVTTPTVVPGATYTGFFSYATGPNCTNIPALGNTVVSASSVCGGQSVTLSLETPPTGFGLTYQWQSSTDGQNFIDIPNATTATYTTTVIADTYYQAVVSCGASTGKSTPKLVTVFTATTITETTGDTICFPTSTTATLGASASSGTIYWYASQTGGLPLHTGNTFITPPISETTTFYAATDVTANNFTKTFSGSSTINANYSGNIFNTSSTIVLRTVKVYPKQTNTGDNLPITIAVFDASGALVGTPMTFTPTANTTNTLLPYTVIFTNPITIPAGIGYKLLAIDGLSTTNGLGRNTQTLPFTQGAVTITNGLSSNGATPDTNFNEFYDWTWDEVCPTDRVPVIATVHQAPVVSTITGITDVCIGSTNTLAAAPTGGVWLSENPAVATVDPATGEVTGISEGTSVITYTLTTNGCTSSVSATVTTKVLPNVAAITGLTDVCVNSDIILASTTAGGEWTSATPSVATVDAVAGIVTGVSAGTSVITYTVNANGCSNSATTTVTVIALPVITPAAGTTICGVGNTLTLSATPSGGVWTSADDAVVTVDSAGLVTGKSIGTANIIYSVDGACSNKIPITVNDLPTVAPITGTTNTCVGSTTALLSNTQGGVWTSDNTDVATIDSSTGIVTGISVGTAPISYSVTTNGCTGAATTTVTINPALEIAEITGNTTIDVNSTTQLSSLTSGGIWSSDNPEVASVDPLSGLVTSGTIEGTATIVYLVSNGNCIGFVSTEVTVSTLANDKFDLPTLNYYPNPIKDVLNISYATNIKTVSIYNLLGQELRSVTINANWAKIDMSSLPNAAYMVKINLDDNLIKTIKVIKQ